MTGATIDLGGVRVDLVGPSEAMARILAGASRRRQMPLGVVSANLDHVFHFGRRGRWRGVLDPSSSRVEWLSLLDGQPLVAQANRITGRVWPRLAGSDLIADLLEAAQAQGVVVGFLGGRPDMHTRLRRRLRETWPRLVVGGYWSPDREVLVDRRRALALAHEVRESGTQMLFVGLGKPRQEVWIAEYARESGAGVLLAFGASADFVAGTARRAPRLVVASGLEWLWRLAREPKRLARRYLVEGPGAYLDLRRHSGSCEAAIDESAHVARPMTSTTLGVPTPGLPPDLTAVVVTYNSAGQVGALLRDLAAASVPRTVVVDNCSSDDTRAVVRRAGCELIEAPGNLGYAGAINLAMHVVRPPGPVLVLNPDLRVPRESPGLLWRRMQVSRAGVVVPRVLDEDGEVFRSLRFEPSLLGGVGDALCGSRLASRPPWASETDLNPESYQLPHTVDWATGAALLISQEAIGAGIDWNEDFFLYSEETDYLRRVREAGMSIWFEPAAEVVHAGQGSGSSPQLAALMAVNRVRYAELHHGRRHAQAARAVVVLSALLRVGRGPGHRCSLRYLVQRGSWGRLPSATRHSGTMELSPRARR